MYSRKTVKFVYSKYLSGMSIEDIVNACYAEGVASLRQSDVEFIIDQKNIYTEIW